MNKAERRKYERIDARVKVELTPYQPGGSQAVTRNAESRNISTGGLLVSIDSPLEISSYVRARFTMPESSAQKEIIAKVVRVDEVESMLEYNIGLEFIEKVFP